MATSVVPPGFFRSINPARPSQVVGEFRGATAATAVEAVEQAAVAQRAWAASVCAERATVIGGVAHAIARRTHDFVDLIVREQGKPRVQAEGEVRKSVEQFHFASQLAYLAEGATYQEEEAGTAAFTLRTPLGVVVAITPWNFPLSLPARKLAAALALGNAVVFKPSPVTAATGELLWQTCTEAGLPPGVLQLVQGEEPAAMRALVGHSTVRAVTFTGSDAVGALLRQLVQPQARLQFELGGHNVAAVCADADLDRAAIDITAAAFGQTGQTCTSSDRVLVEQSVYEEFCAALAKRVGSLRVGPGDRAGVSCGPVATPAQQQRLTELDRSARATGARVLGEGQFVADLDPEGFWILPTVFADLPSGHPLLTTEVFGPMLCVLPVESTEDAVDIINSSAHGLVASVHTAALTTAYRFAHEVRCGMIKINGKTTGNGIGPPFGGWKASSSGAFPEGGRQAIDFFTDTKTVYCTY